MYKKLFLLFVSICCLSVLSLAQDSSKFYFTTSVGLLSPVGGFSQPYKTSLALNSGIEYKIVHAFFAQLVLDFNAVKYSQQVKDINSDYLFQQTNSSIFLAGLNVGKNFSVHPGAKLFSSVYAGSGYVNIGEPRLSVNTSSYIIEQQVKRMPGIFAKVGFRGGYKTHSAFLQTIYIDGSFWTSNLSIQQTRAQALSLYAGTRFAF
jgi:hypothetical protein